MNVASKNTAVVSFPDSRLGVTTLACRRGGRLVFEGLDFDVGPGELLLLEGKNGSGKTTLLRLLAGYLSSVAGSINYDSKKLAARDIPHTGAFLYSGHQHGLKAVLTLRENISSLYQLMTGCQLPDALLYDAAEAFALGRLIDHPVGYFSSGQTHRCALLRFAVLERPVWLMDEPTVGLDADNRVRLEKLMQAHLHKGGIIIAASHDPINLPHNAIDMATYEPKAAVEEIWL
ncbi:MAG: heme ABC exporter ATP-binding protein CcmA [Kordiimonadaceae bacterium]|nr:heme ABC exporter ATP-binding protein CcmA [Kordiimonadaceae bacterium]